MKLVIKDKASGLYCQKGGSGWTAFFPQASDFKTMTEAVKFGREQAIPDFIVTLEFFGMSHSILLADCEGPAFAVHQVAQMAEAEV